jgi:hypothetical protein
VELPPEPPEEAPPAEVPPPADEPVPEPPLPEPPVSLLAPPPEDSSEVPPDSLAPEVPLPVVLDELFVEVLVAAEACASFSADVFVGGVMFGVLLGIASEALEPPPQAPSVRAQRVMALAPSAARVAREAALVLKAAPCAARRSGSR